MKTASMSSVRLVNASSESMLDEIAFTARVSNPANQNNTKTSEKLVRYLIREGHWSPFEMVSATLEIETTRDIARQMLRHRSFSFQEFSQRYAEVDGLGNPVFREARGQDLKNRQNSVRLPDGPLHNEWLAKQRNAWEAAKTAYDWALEQGIAKEQARAVLPEGITPSRLYMSGSIRSWIHFVELRSGNGTQLEHQKVAVECAEALSGVFPMILEFVDGAYDPNA
jgi:thymidylate synthase (FAD)